MTPTDADPNEPEDTTSEEKEEESDAAEESEAPSKSLFRPGNAPLGTVTRMQDVKSDFGDATAQFAKERSGHGFAVRLFGGAIGDEQVDAVLLGGALTRLGRAAAWINNALAGRRTVPGVEYAEVIASVVVQFSAAPDEELYPEEGRTVAPTAISGDLMASLLISDEDVILGAVEKLRPRASGTYLKALEELAENEVSAEWLLLDEVKPRRIESSRGKIVDTIEVLDQPVKTVRRTVQVSGVIYAADQYGHTFKMDVIEGGDLEGKTIRGDYGSAASKSLEGAWRKRVDATIGVHEAAKPGLPRAPRTRYELARVRRIYDRPVPLEPGELRG